MKKSKTRAAHTPASPKGIGQYYGQGVRNPVGKLRGGMNSPVVPSKLKTPPKSLA